MIDGNIIGALISLAMSLLINDLSIDGVKKGIAYVKTKKICKSKNKKSLKLTKKHILST